MTDDSPRWVATDKQFGYCPFENKIAFSTVPGTTINGYVLHNEYFTRNWKCHVFNSCTSAIMQLMLHDGIHLGDAGGFGSRDEIGYFLPRSDYGKRKGRTPC